MLAPGRDLTVDEVAEELGLPVAMIQRRIDAGDLPVRWVEVNGRLEVRVPAPGADGRPAFGSANGHPGPNEQGRRSAAPAGSAPRGGGRAAAELPLSSGGGLHDAHPALAALPIPPTGLAEVDTRELVIGLLDRWEQALERRIEAEQRLRFETELERRTHQVRQLHSELDGTRRAHAEEMAEREHEAMALRSQLRDLEMREARRRPWWRRS